MRESRDTKLARIQELQQKVQQLAVQSERVSHENLQLQSGTAIHRYCLHTQTHHASLISDFQRTHGRQQEIEDLRRRISEGNDAITTGEEAVEQQRQRLENQERVVAEKRPDIDAKRKRLEEAVEVYNQMMERFLTLQREADHRVRSRRRQSEEKIPSRGVSASNSVNQQLYNVPPDAEGNEDAVRRGSKGGPGRCKGI